MSGTKIPQAQHALSAACQDHLGADEYQAAQAQVMADFATNPGAMVDIIRTICEAAGRSEQFAGRDWDTDDAEALAEQVIARALLFAPVVGAAAPVSTPRSDSPGEPSSPSPPERRPTVADRTEWPSPPDIEEFLAAQDELDELIGRLGRRVLSPPLNRGLRRKLQTRTIKDKANGWTADLLAERLALIEDEIARVSRLLTQPEPADPGAEPVASKKVEEFGKRIPRANRMRLLQAQDELREACRARPDMPSHALLREEVTAADLRETTEDWPTVQAVDDFAQVLREAVAQLPPLKLEPVETVNNDPVQPRTWEYLTLTLLPRLSALPGGRSHHLLNIDTSERARNAAREADVAAHCRQVEAAIEALSTARRPTEEPELTHHGSAASTHPDEGVSGTTMLMVAGVILVGVLLLVIVISLFSGGSGSTDALDQIRQMSQ